MEKGVMNTPKNAPRTSSTTHVFGKSLSVASSDMRCGRNCLSILLERRYRRSASYYKDAIETHISHKLKEEFVSRKPNHATDPRTKMVFNQHLFIY